MRRPAALRSYRIDRRHEPGAVRSIMAAQAAIAVPSRLVLVVDDDPAVRNSLKFSLEIEGFTVRDYANASALLRDAAMVDDGCLVVDYHLPEMDGLEMLARLRERHIAARAILITSHPTAAVRRRAAQAGVPIIEKPLLGNALLDSIRSALEPASPP